MDHVPDTSDSADPPLRDEPILAAHRPVAVLPTLLTLGNALCGFFAVFMASRPATTELPWNWTPITFSGLFIFMGMLFDALDGRVARMTRSTSDLGVQLDSMADMVSFGVAPAFMAVQLIGVQTPFVGLGVKDAYFDRAALIAAALYVACTALRLARFNIESKSPEESAHQFFKGLPSPGAAGTIVSLILLHEHIVRHSGHVRFQQAAAMAMLLIMPLVAYAMVSRLRYVHVVNRYMRGMAPFGWIVRVVGVGLLMSLDLQGTLAAAFVIYSLSAPVKAVWLKWRPGRSSCPSCP